MSYYTIAPPYYGYRAPSPPHAYDRPSSYGPRHLPHPHHAPPPHHGPPPSHHAHPQSIYDLDEEERVALAHLRYIRQQREAQQAAREQAARRAKEERENAIRRAIAEKRRQEAIAQAAAALKKQREREIQEAVERERERVRAAIMSQRQRQLPDVRLRQPHQAQIQAAQHHHPRQLQIDNHTRQLPIEQPQPRAGTDMQRAISAPHVAKDARREHKDEYEVLNNLLGSLFGITLEDERERQTVKADTKPATVPTHAPPIAQPTPAPVAHDSTSFPEDVNDLLSQYLGLRIEPEANQTSTTPTSGPKPAAPTNTVPHGLNDFLSRYGLVFEPLDVAEETKALDPPKPSPPHQQNVELPPTSVADPPEPVLPAPAAAFPAPTPQPRSQQAKDDHPITNYFDGMVDLPPFLRDILGGAEVAYNQRAGRGVEEEAVDGKGKSVAEGEKNEAPATAPSEAINSIPKAGPQPEQEIEEDVNEVSKALATLSTISSDLNLARDSFDFPPTLAFATPSPDKTNPPALLFNKVNSGYHAQTHKLLQLLLAADAIQSNGNKEVRRKRKEIVREVEQEIEKLEKKRDEMWAQMQSGEHEHHDIETESSCASSAVDPTEVREGLETEHVEDVKKGEESEEATAESDVKESTEPAASGVKHHSVMVEEVEDEEENQAGRVEKDAGYEVL